MCDSGSPDSIGRAGEAGADRGEYERVGFVVVGHGNVRVGAADGGEHLILGRVALPGGVLLHRLRRDLDEVVDFGDERVDDEPPQAGAVVV